MSIRSWLTGLLHGSDPRRHGHSGGTIAPDENSTTGTTTGGMLEGRTFGAAPGDHDDQAPGGGVGQPRPPTGPDGKHGTE